jgi:hypothetical protein
LNSGYEENIIEKASHLRYMGGLKLLVRSDENIKKQLQMVTTFSDIIHRNSDLTSLQRMQSSKENYFTLII